jgi:hypothetical protein
VKRARFSLIATLLATSSAACSYPDVVLRASDAAMDAAEPQDSTLLDAAIDSAPDAMPDSAPDSTPDSALDATNDAMPDSAPDSAPDAMPDSAPDSAPDAMPSCRDTPYRPSQTEFEANSAGFGMTMASFERARTQAQFQCNMVCGTTCTLAASPTEGCRYDAAMMGYVCVSFCVLPPAVYQGSSPGCGVAGACFTTAVNAAVAACNARCAGTCSVSTGASDACEFAGSISGYRCRSSCLCPDR